MITEAQRKDWIDKGYDVSTLKHRELLAEVIDSYWPFTGLLDVGCATGADLTLYRMLFPTHLHGFDIDQGNIMRGKELRGELEYSLEVGDLRKALKTLKTKDDMDIVVSNGVLMYVEPEWIKELMRIAKKAVILSEKDPYKGKSISKFLKESNIEYKTTKITKEVRQSWANDGFIYEICL